MSKIFRVKMLPALHGDCIWIEYGEEGAPKRVLIDGGPVGAFPALRAEIEKLPPDQRTFELLVVTHIDADHIDGIVKLLRHPELGVRFQEVWFNGWPQLKVLTKLAVAVSPEEAADETRAPISGSYLQHLLIRRGDGCNARFLKRAVCVADAGLLPLVRLEGGLELTLLSPTIDKLRCLRETWFQAFLKWGGDPGDETIVKAKLDADKRFRGDEGAVPAVPAGVEGAAALAPMLDPAVASGSSTDEAAAPTPVLDTAVANGSSIAFVAEYAGRRCAFLGDAHAPLVERSLRRMAKARGESRLQLAAVKVSHHGSKGNTTLGLLRAIDCRSYLISTDGSVFKHPDDEAIRCIVQYAKPVRLHFNYRSDRTKGWGTAEPTANPEYTAHYPAQERANLELDLLDPIAAP